jgi:carboxylesterase type B
MKVISIIILIVNTWLALAKNSPELEVDLNDGKILGRYMASQSGRTIRAFMGIPFAEPPIDELRFRAPVKKASWRPNTLRTQTEPKKCPQTTSIVAPRVLEGDEDCLYLNVYAPEVDSSSRHGKHPVMVYFHGGSFLGGHGGVSELGPDYFLDTDVILVVGNYRLGVLGFMSTENEESPGNYGMKDQVALLRWVNENIDSFGGDKNSVTIFGESVRKFIERRDDF